jgi:hypothetical protein
MVEVCNKITPETYQEKLEYVEDNYKRSFNYHDFRKRIEFEVTKFLEKN